MATSGLDIAIREYEFNFEERHIPLSNALHSVLRDRGNYHTGPLARYALNFDRLSPIAQQAAIDVPMQELEFDYLACLSRRRARRRAG